MRRIIGALALVGAIALGTAGDSAAQPTDTCRRTAYRLDSSVRAAESIMNVNQDGRCGSRLNQSFLREPRIERRATNGRVELDGNNYVYIPNPGFTGGDRFVVSWANAPDGSRVALTVSVRVDPPGTPPPAAAAAPRTPARCGGTGFHIDREHPIWSETLTVRANQRCDRMITGMQYDRGIRIDRPAANGQVEVGPNSYSYVPNPGFTGSDEFRISWFNPLVGSRVGVAVNVRVLR
jgi:hypothetical protein